MTRAGRSINRLNMIHGILLTHGNLAEELLRTAGTIYGDITNCVPISNAKESQQSLIEELDAIISKGGADNQFMVLTDFLGGSCSHAGLAVARRHRNVRVVTGLSLPMLIAFLYRRNEVPIEELAEEIVAKGRENMAILDWENL